MTAAIFAFACVALLAVLLWLDRRTQNSSPAVTETPAAGEDHTRGAKLAGRYWLTEKGYAALAEHDQEQQP